MSRAECLPWRYRCPACGSTQIHRYSLSSIPTTHEAGRGRRVATSGHKRGILNLLPRYWCRVCGERFDTPRDMLRSHSSYQEMRSAHTG